MRTPIARTAWVAVVLAALAAGCGGGLKYIQTNLRTESQWRPLEGTSAPVLAARRAEPPPTEVPLRKIDIRGKFVAVFDIQDQSKVLSRTELDGLTDYLAGKLAEGGLFHVVPREEIKKRLLEQKKDSYKQCYNQSCQIEIGREIAAQKTLSLKISPIGSSCIVTAALYDLKKAATDATATTRGTCAKDDYLSQIEKIVDKFRRMAK